MADNNSTSKKDRKGLSDKAVGLLELLWNTTGASWRFFSSDLRRSGVGFSSLVLVEGLFPVLRASVYALLINQIVVVFQSHELTNILFWATGGVIFLDIAHSLIRNWRNTWDMILNERMSQYASIEMLKKVGSLDVASLEDPDRKNLIEKAQRGAFRMSGYLLGQTDLARSIFVAATASGAILWNHPWLFVFIVFGTLPDLIVNFVYSRENWRYWDGTNEARRRFNVLGSFFRDAQSLIETKIFQLKDYLLGLAQGRSDKYVLPGIALRHRRGRAEAMADLLNNLVLGGVAVWAVVLIWRGALDVGGFSFLMSMVATFRSNLGTAFHRFAMQYESALFVSDFVKLQDLAPIIASPKAGVKISRIEQIVFEDIYFRYPKSQKDVLAGVNLNISSGEKIALIGLNGAGKTTLIKLLCRFYDPTAGRICVNGIDLREVDLDSYYAALSLLSQSFSSCQSFDVEHAVWFGRVSEAIDLPRIDSALGESQAREFVDELPNGRKQVLGRTFTDGIGLSGGQWQKLALARAFYRNADLLILDEPTSAVDAQSEMKIFDKIAAMGSSQTALFISHRFSTVRQANRIILLENGKITEDGPHQQLMANSKEYARLYKLQARAFETQPPFA